MIVKLVESSLNNGYRKLKVQDPMITDDPIFSKMDQFKAVTLFYQRSSKFREIVRNTVVLRSYQVNETFAFTKGFYEMEN